MYDDRPPLNRQIALSSSPGTGSPVAEWVGPANRPVVPARSEIVADPRFSWGAQLLLWVFPLLLVVSAIAAHLIEGRRSRRR
jgi:hypothetical protein